MRTALCALLPVLALPAFAQCPFDPVIAPSDILLYCADEEVELSTMAGDAYQWYRDGIALDGATSATYTASQVDAGSQFTVAVTVDGCTELSATRLVDSWMGLWPYLQHGGDEPYEIGDGGVSYYCVGDTANFTLGGSYTANVVWYKDGEPIPGETGMVLEVTTTGAYTATAELAQCPGQGASVGVEVGMVFTAPTQPVIAPSGNTLCAFPTGAETQWYLDGEALSTEACIELAGPGVYTVFVDYHLPCQVLSAPFVATGVRDAAGSSFTAGPVPASEVVRIGWPAGHALQGAWQLVDLTGRAVRTGRFAAVNAVDIDVRALAPGKYWFSALKANGWAPVPVAVVR